LTSHRSATLSVRHLSVRSLITTRPRSKLHSKTPAGS
jgi:hypothetical protein